jgi:membrane protease YdiL (CAAX protease family)
MLAIALIQGIDMQAFLNTMMSGEGEFPLSLLRGMLWVQSIVAFILPALVFAIVFYRKKWLQYFALSRAPSLIIILTAIIALFAAYPLVQLSFELNSALTLPEWMTSMEENAAEILKDILFMDSTGSFLLTLLLVAVLPGIGEELVFRGILQRQIQDWTRRPVLSVWIAAIIFSAIHMQFEGFFPRVVLGAVLGFTYLWSRNLWIPIIVHAVNNGTQVSVLYFTGVDLSNIEKQQEMELNAWIITGSVLALYGCYHIISRTRLSHGEY